MARHSAQAPALSRPSLVLRIGVAALLWMLVSAALLLFARPAEAQTIIVERWAADEAPVELTWTETVAVENPGYAKASQRFVPFAVEPTALRPALASYGPFRLVAPDTVEMAGTVDSASPRDFAALMAAHPGVKRLVMVDCPGSIDEAANHLLARAVRRAGLKPMFRKADRSGRARSSCSLPASGAARMPAPSSASIAGATRMGMRHRIFPPMIRCMPNICPTIATWGFRRRLRGVSMR